MSDLTTNDRYQYAMRLLNCHTRIACLEMRENDARIIIESLLNAFTSASVQPTFYLNFQAAKEWLHEGEK